MPVSTSRPLYNRGILAAAALLVLFGGLAMLQSTPRYYPFLKLDVPNMAPGAGTAANLSLTMLVEAHTSGDRCERTLASVASSMLSVCPQCRASAQQCLNALSPDQNELLSEQPLHSFTARLPNGITRYESTDPAIARFSCEESERQSLINGVTVKCYPPGTARPHIKTSTSKQGWWAQTTTSSHNLWVVLALISFITLVAQLTVPQLPVMGARVLKMPRRSKQVVLLATDILSIELSLWAAIAIRLDTFSVPSEMLIRLGLIAPLIAIPLFVRFGLYRAVIHYIGLHALLAIGKAVTIYAGLLAVGIYLIGIPDVPHSIALIHGILAMLLIGGSRTLARHWLSNASTEQSVSDRRKPVIVYGAGSAGVQLAAALAHSRELKPVAMVDDDPALHRKQIGALDVYAPGQLQQLIDRYAVAEVLLALPSASRARRNEIIDQLEHLPVLVRTLPGVAELAEGKVKTADLREVDIEDLLGRDPVAPDLQLLGANITGKSVMVTGAGGSIGSELCRQILAQRPKHIVLFELSEFALYSIEQDLQKLAETIPRFATNIWPILGSVTEAPKLERVIKHFAVQTIYHAAAYKHVPMVEKNPCEGILNNIFGTWQLAHAALDGGVETFVLISTDKAVRPTNIMGTTKRFAEMILQALAAELPNKTRFTMVRFGNVLGSSGSVVPLFREQIKMGGPITVTDPRIIRYFMTIPEAAQLVIQAGAMGSDGDVFVLDMGEPVKILDLAYRMVHLSGLTVKNEDNADGDVEIVFSGLRPGEKLYEELLIGDNVTATTHPRVRQANEKRRSLAEVTEFTQNLRLACEVGDSDLARTMLLKAVEEFAPQCTNQDVLLN